MHKIYYRSFSEPTAIDDRSKLEFFFLENSTSFFFNLLFVKKKINLKPVKATAGRTTLTNYMARRLVIADVQKSHKYKTRKNTLIIIISKYSQ